MFAFKEFVEVLPFIAMFFFCTSLSASEMPLYELKIKVFPENHSIEGRAKITIPGGLQTSLQTGDLNIKSFRINGQEYRPNEIFQDDTDTDFDNSNASQNTEIQFDEDTYYIEAKSPKVIEIYYTAIFEVSHQKDNISVDFPARHSPLPPIEGAQTRRAGLKGDGLGEGEKRGFLRCEHNRITASNFVDKSGVLLLSNYYPALQGLSIYELTVEIPSDFDAISESESETVIFDRENKIVRFDFSHPISGVTLVAGKYWVKEEKSNGIKIKTYLLSKDERLATDYIEGTKHYVKLYESMLGKYPYKTFSIVENRFQGGCSFPTYQLLNSREIRPPATAMTALGHEILHQWFGNHVFVDYRGGNWSEGLTTYLSDHRYKDLKGRGSEYRKKIMIDYTNYVSSDNEIRLRDFIRQEDFSSRTIGYGKAAMVFHMLRKGLGDDVFSKAIKQFVASNRYKKATWKDIEDSFASLSKEDLEPFFDQWVQKKGVPSIEVKEAGVSFRNGKYLLNLEIIQATDPFIFELPVRVKTAQGQEEFEIGINKKKTLFERQFSKRPLRIFLDENYDIMRRLNEKERPPVISAFTGDKKSIAIFPENEGELLGEIAEFFKTRGYTVKTEKEITNEDIKKNSILIIGVKNRIYRRLFADRPLPEGGFVVRVDKNPINPDRVAVIFKTRNIEELRRAFGKIFMYGNYSLLVFEKGENISKEIADSEMGIIKDLGLTVEAVEMKNNTGLDEITEKIEEKRVIYIGELHDQYSHHLMQYEVIKRLYEKHKKLIIGMEMFQRPFQKYLDMYIQGEIPEDELIIKTEYFKRWKFNYNLYRDIIHFARANSLPIVALNLRGEIVEKVSKNGIDSLTEDEFAAIPQAMDMTNQTYSDYLRKVFSMHTNNQKRDFENFFQSQILWDETMAHTIAEALRKYPDRQMVVLAGNGHLQHSWGIPDRVKRLVNQSSAIILNYGGYGFKRGIADFVLFPAKIEAPKSPKLMVYLKRAEEGVVIEKLLKGGVAEKAGLNQGDVIKAIDDKVIDDISDVKVVLLNRKIGDHIKVKILRKRFILGPKEIVFDLAF